MTLLQNVPWAVIHLIPHINQCHVVCNQGSTCSDEWSRAGKVKILHLSIIIQFLGLLSAKVWQGLYYYACVLTTNFIPKELWVHFATQRSITAIRYSFSATKFVTPWFFRNVMQILLKFVEKENNKITIQFLHKITWQFKTK